MDCFANGPEITATGTHERLFLRSLRDKTRSKDHELILNQMEETQ